MKKLLCTTVLVVLLTVFLGLLSTAHALNLSADAAINWVKSKNGTTVGTGQCVSLVAQYIRELGGKAPSVDVAAEYSTCTVPTGFTRIQKANCTPRKGDILIWTGGNNGAGHVAIYESDYSAWHQNVSNRQYVQNLTYYYTLEAWDKTLVYWGVMRPNFSNDTEPPVISNVQVSNVTADGYTVTCSVTDNVGVTQVRFPTWAVPNDQDDLLWADGTISNGTASFRVKTSDHGNQKDCYYVTHIYAYDAAGNQAAVNTNHYSSLQVYVPSVVEEHYTITLDPNGGSASTTSLPVTLNSSDYYEISWCLPTRFCYTFSGWYTAASGGVQVYDKYGYCTNEGTYWSNNFYVKRGNAKLYAHWTEAKPGQNTLTVTAGNSNTETVFAWTTPSNTEYYSLCIKNTETNQYWGRYHNLTVNSYRIVLPAGSYQAYVMPRNSNGDGYNLNYSNFVNFEVEKRPGKSTLTVTPGDSTTETQFAWTSTANTDYYKVLICDSNTLDILYSSGETTTTSYRYVLPAGTYKAIVFAYAVVGSQEYQKSSDFVTFVVEESTSPGQSILSVSPGDSASNTVFTWTSTDNTYYYSLLIDNTQTGAGLSIQCSTNRPSYEMVLPAGSYKACVYSEKDESYTKSNTVYFVIEEAPPGKCILTVTPGTDLSQTEFRWTDPENADTSKLYVFTVDGALYRSSTQGATYGALNQIIPAGNYKAYVEASSGAGSTLSDTVYFSVDACVPDLILPDGITAIDEEAFMGIDAEVVYVPNGCKSIGSMAFANCPNLRYVVVYSRSSMTIASDALSGTNAKIIQRMETIPIWIE